MSDSTMDDAGLAALAAWRALPDDERNGERPYIMGFNAGWEEAIKQAAEVARQTKAYDDATQKGAGCLTTGERIGGLIWSLVGVTP